ncbi:MAG: hypothetical protein RLZZ519_651 [Bacteroidota bacterium]
MFRVVLGLSVAAVLLPLASLSQGQSHADTIPTSPFLVLTEYLIEVPLGQTFIAPARCPGATTTRYSLPEGKPAPICHLDTTSEQHLRATLSMGMHTNKAVYQSQTTMRGSSTAVSYRMAGSMTIDDDPSKYVMELNVDPKADMMMKLDLGYGSARIDLSDTRMHALRIVSGAADVVVCYNKPSAAPMKLMHLSGGMSKIVVRNLDLARAANVSIENAMGDTKIVVGNGMTSKSMVRIDVGAGSCTLLVHKDAPVKIIINSTIFSSAPIPEGFVKTGDNTFVSHAYKIHSQEAMTLVVDLGLGSFELVPFE